MNVPRRASPKIAWAVAWLAISTLSGCGSDGSSPEQPPTAPAAVASVVIEPGSVLLTVTGETRTLVARAYDAEGGEIEGRTVSWSSSAPANLSVSQAGEVQAGVANGSAQITARIDNVVSGPVLAVVTQLAAGTVVLDDEDISGEVRETATNGPAGTPGNTLEFTLSAGVEPPAVGAIVVGTGEKPVAGHVTEVVESDGQTVVRFAPGPLLEVFPELVINEVFQLGPDDVEVNPDIAASYDVVRDGSRLSFTPKAIAAASAGNAVLGALAAGTPIGTSALPPFSECEYEGPSLEDLPLSLSAPPLFSFDFEPQIEIVKNAPDRIDRWLVTGPAEFAVEAGLGVKFAFEGSLTCKAELVTLRVPVGGPLSLLVGGLIPVGVGFKVSGELTVAELEAKTKIGSTANVSLGLACTEDDSCSMVRTLENSQFQLEPELTLPGGTTGLDQLRLALGAQLFGYAEVEFGSPLFERLRLEALEAKAGAGLEGEFAPRFTQVSDTSFKAKYDGKGFVGVEAGTELSGLAARLGLDEITFLQLGLEFPFAASPTGRVRANRGSFLIGENVAFTVNLDAPTMEFIPGVGPFNVRDIVLVRSVPGGVQEVARTPAVAGQTDYAFDVVAPASGLAAEYFGFVVTVLAPLDFFSVEVDNAAALEVSLEVSPATATLTPGDTQDFDATVFGAADTSVSWDLPDGGGSITVDGVFTAGTTNGTYTVRARSVEDTSKTGTATVHVNAGSTTGRVVFERNNDLWVLVPDSTPTNITPGTSSAETEPEISPDGTRIVFRQNGAVAFINTDGTGLSVTGHNCLFPSWAGNGQSMVCYDINATPDRIRRLGADGGFLGNIEMPSGLTLGYGGVGLSPDGERLVFSAREVGGAANVYTMNLDGTGLINVTNNPPPDPETRAVTGCGDPNWSPDGGQIVMVCGDGDFSSGHIRDRLQIFAATGGAGRTLVTVDDPITLQDPDWSPDGTALVYTWFDDGEEYGAKIYRIDAAAGADNAAITSGPEDWSPSWGQ